MVPAYSPAELDLTVHSPQTGRTLYGGRRRFRLELFMALRFMQIFLPTDTDGVLEKVLEEREVLGVWRDANSESRTVLHLLVPAEETEPIMDRFAEHFNGVEGFHVVLFPVEAVLPRPEPAETKEAKENADDTEKEEKDQRSPLHLRVSREELYNEVVEAVIIDPAFLAMTALSALVATMGLVNDDVAVVIGAMVIAPLLGPNVAMSLAVTLNDTALLRRGLLASGVGILVVTAVAVAYGLLFTVDPTVQAIAQRTHLDLGNITLALGAGAAGTFAYTRGVAGAVIGVMVAVALVPPLVVFGMMMAQGQFILGGGALLLTLANIICINLAGTATFALQGVRPRAWWEAERASKATRRAIAIWLILLAGLVAILLVYKV